MILKSGKMLWTKNGKTLKNAQKNRWKGLKKCKKQVRKNVQK